MKPFSADTPILGSPAHATIGDFWRWAYSDVLSNRNRGIFAEYAVALALGIHLSDTVRMEWGPYDLLYEDKEIEVKCAAYLQNWYQSRPSSIIYDIARKRAWDANTGITSPELKRASFCYVFCLFIEPDINKANVLDMNQWRFYVMRTSTMDEVFNDQKKVSLSVLSRHCHPVPFGELKATIDGLS